VKPYYHILQPESLTGEQVDHLLALGWYRMHQEIFTTSHVQLREVYRVHWLRYGLDELQGHASHKRIRQRAKHFTHTVEDFVMREEHALLHKRYRNAIDFEGAHSITDCLFGGEEIIPSIFNTKTVSVYEGGKLIAVGYFDVGELGAASILHFFDSDYKRFSLGKYLMLLTIDFLRDHGYQFYYPGYVVEGNPKMDYKLFLGREEAQYFDPIAVEWRYFEERILND
jgi:arginyl-tRNA--protein-N-Asp/Glu arginylyltransferase